MSGRQRRRQRGRPRRCSRARQGSVRCARAECGCCCGDDARSNRCCRRRSVTMRRPRGRECPLPLFDWCGCSCCSQTAGWRSTTRRRRGRSRSASGATATPPTPAGRRPLLTPPRSPKRHRSAQRCCPLAADLHHRHLQPPRRMKNYAARHHRGRRRCCTSASLPALTSEPLRSFAALFHQRLCLQGNRREQRRRRRDLAAAVGSGRHPCCYCWRWRHHSRCCCSL